MQRVAREDVVRLGHGGNAHGPVRSKRTGISPEKNTRFVPQSPGLHLTNPLQKSFGTRPRNFLRLDNDKGQDDTEVNAKDGRHPTPALHGLVLVSRTITCSRLQICATSTSKYSFTILLTTNRRTVFAFFPMSCRTLVPTPASPQGSRLGIDRLPSEARSTPSPPEEVQVRIRELNHGVEGLSIRVDVRKPRTSTPTDPHMQCPWGKCTKGTCSALT